MRIAQMMTMSIYEGVSENGFKCYIFYPHFVYMRGPTGYVVVPKSVVKNNNFKNDSDRCTVHGGVTYFDTKFNDTKFNDEIIKLKESYVIGFDTSHYDSPRPVTMEFMENELIGLSKELYDLSIKETTGA